MTKSQRNWGGVWKVAAGMAATAIMMVGLRAYQADAKPEFANVTIDLGTVVTDIEKSAKFYTEVIGFKEVPGFSVPADFAAEAGLTDPKITSPLKIRVFVLGEGPGATKLKLMQIEGAKPKLSENETIHAQTGFRYLTLSITDTNRAMARIEKAGIKPVAKSPAAIPESIAKGIFLTIVKDPDGNIIELVGPKS